MADLVITAANVVPGANAVFQQGPAAVTITQGQTVYLDSSTGTVKLADADLSAAAASVSGIAVSSALAGQIVVFQVSGTLAFGAILTAAKPYFLSATAGAIAPAADLTTNWRTSLLGFASSTSNLLLNIFNSGFVN